MTEDLLKGIEERAERVSQLLEYASRAFVIEFAGTPKSGKSTSVEAIRHFFTRHRFRVHVLAEQAAMCPIPMKGHLFFNTWCAASMLAELLANVETETDIIIVDRGILDALVWLTLQRERGELTEEEARTFEEFLLLDRWRSLIDLAIVMTVDAEKALEREAAQRLTAKTGSIMNLDVLRAITASVDKALAAYGTRFAGVYKQNTTDKNFKESGAALATRILDSLEEFLNPEILVVPRRDLEAFTVNGPNAFGASAVSSVLAFLSNAKRFMRRAAAESSDDYVQIIPCGVLCYRDQVFPFERKEKDPKSALFGTTTLWQGCHVNKENSDVASLLKNALMDRVSRSLFLNRKFPANPKGYCWDRENPKSSRHFGVIFRIDIDNEASAADLRKKEFRKKRGHGLAGGFKTWESVQIARQELRLEPWSQAILESSEAFK